MPEIPVTRAPPTAAPPRAPIALRVSVVGHRPDRLPQDEAGLAAIRRRLAEALSSVARAAEAFRASPDAAAYAPSTPRLIANSPLAEGADRVFAEEAVRLGYELACVMPFAQEEFETDFRSPNGMAPGALDEFHRLLAQARRTGKLTVFELDGDPARRNEAYEAAGRVVVNQSDLLIAVWDGGADKGIGGTVDTLRAAIDFDVPVLWIDCRAPYGWRLLRSESELEGLTGEDAYPPAATDTDDAADAALLDAALAEVVTGELALPANAAEQRAHLRDYLRERRPRYNFAFTWKLVRDLLDRGVPRLPAFRVRDYVDQISADWPIDSGSDAGKTRAWINAALRPHYAWSDQLADRYADAHRSGFVLSSLMAALAVFLALLPMAAGWGLFARLSYATAVAEAVLLVVMIGLPLLARRWRWRERWMEYRVLAELIRELHILIPLGGGRPLPRTPPHLANYGDPTQSWMYWQVRAIARATGLPSAEVTGDYAGAQLADLAEFLGAAPHGRDPGRGQIGFHHNNCERLERIHRRLHQMSLGLFLISIGGVVVDWLKPLMALTEAIVASRWLTLISAFFPALGAAFASINNQGEFGRLQRRSRAMADGFEVVQHQIKGLQAKAPQISLASVTELAARVAAMMVDENSDWRIVVLDPPHTG